MKPKTRPNNKKKKSTIRTLSRQDDDIDVQSQQDSQPPTDGIKIFNETSSDNTLSENMPLLEKLPSLAVNAKKFQRAT